LCRNLELRWNPKEIVVNFGRLTGRNFSGILNLASSKRQTGLTIRNHPSYYLEAMPCIISRLINCQLHCTYMLEQSRQLCTIITCYCTRDDNAHQTEEKRDKDTTINCGRVRKALKGESTNSCKPCM
jgi:hypothetical protein